MANPSFEMIGSLKLAKATEKKPTFEVKKCSGDWQLKVLRLNMNANGNSNFVEIVGMFGGDNSDIYSMVKKEGQKGKYENVKFKYKDRAKYVKDLAEFKKYVFVNGDDRHEFATQHELAELVHKELQKPEMKDKTFMIKGEIEYNESGDKLYTKYNVSRVYVMNEPKEDEDPIQEKCEANIELYISEGALDESAYDETGQMFLTGYVGVYDKDKKGEVGISQTVEIELPPGKKNREKMKNRIIENLEIKEEEYLSKIGVKVELFAKAPEVEFDESMLTDEEKEDLEYGFTTMEEIKADRGVGKGKFENKLLFTGWSRGFSKGCTSSTQTLETLLAKPSEEADEFEIDDDDLAF